MSVSASGSYVIVAGVTAAAGTPGVIDMNKPLTLISKSNPSSANVTFTGLRGYRVIVLRSYNLLPSSNAIAVWLTTSTDNGSTYDAGASTYDYGVNYLTTGATGFDTGSAAIPKCPWRQMPAAAATRESIMVKSSAAISIRQSSPRVHGTSS